MDAPPSVTRCKRYAETLKLHVTHSRTGGSGDVESLVSISLLTLSPMTKLRASKNRKGCMLSNCASASVLIAEELSGAVMTERGSNV